MANTGLKVQGTEIWLLDAADSGSEVRKIGNITAIGDVGGSAGEIECTNFDSTSKEFLTGLKDNGSITISYNYDPQNAAQTTLKALEGGANKRFVIGLSEAATDVTYTSVFVIPPDRTTFDFSAGVQSMTKGGALDDIWRGTITLRISGDVTEVAAV